MFENRHAEEYVQIPSSDDAQSLIPDSIEEAHRRRSKASSGVWTVLIFSIIALSNVLSCVFGTFIGRGHPSNAGAIRAVSKYSPIIDDVDMKFQHIRFDGSFVHENIFRQDAGPEVDAAWEALGIDFRPVLIPDILATEAGLTSDHVRVKDRYGGGYPAFIEGFHQLHCLNLLRQSLYYNYEYYHSRAAEAFSDPPHVQRWHTSHCLDFLRQRLMCTMDIGVFGSVWVNKTSPHPFVDFNTQHVCRDFNTIREWGRVHQISTDIPDDWLEMPTEHVVVWESAP